MPRRRLPPFETEIVALAKGGAGLGEAPDGKPVIVRPAPPGSRVLVVPTGRKRGTWTARRLALVRPAPDQAAPRCAVFGVCGGCTLQELSLAGQRREKHALAVVQASGLGLDGVLVHPLRGEDIGYGYRNKVELSFGPTRFVSEAEHAAGVPLDGRFLGFHAPGRWDRVVDAARCELVDEPTNTLIGIVRGVALAPDAPAPYDPVRHVGFWRHLLLRHGASTGEHLVVVYTAPARDEAEAEAVRRLARALLEARLDGDTRVVGVVWAENDGVADVARGVPRETFGDDRFAERLGSVSFRLSAGSFFQTNTPAAERLYDTVGEALGTAGGTLLDLYCGTGAIGLYLAGSFDRVVGVEEVEAAVDDARENAARNGIEATYVAARVEDGLSVLADTPGRRSIVVDPPRAGLHPSVARALADADAEVLVYVACNAASLGRDGAVLVAGGWRPTDLWTVDLFPQTGHVEAVARFVRRGE